jgi:hypothetical protein
VAKPVNYFDAAKRHYNDAELLLKNKREANAGHLYGFASECGVKQLLVMHGIRTDPATGDIVENKQDYRVHIDKLVNTMHIFLSGRGADRYSAMVPNIGSFSTWKVAHRYYAESALPASVPDWQKAAVEVMRMLFQADLDGVMK